MGACIKGNGTRPLLDMATLQDEKTFLRVFQFDFPSNHDKMEEFSQMYDDYLQILILVL